MKNTMSGTEAGMNKTGVRAAFQIEEGGEIAVLKMATGYRIRVTVRDSDNGPLIIDTVRIFPTLADATAKAAEMAKDGLLGIISGDSLEDL